MKFLAALWRWITGPRCLFVLLPLFMAVLAIGTLAQKHLGLFTATEVFFHSWFLWWGPIPLPGGLSVLALIAFNMTAHYLMHSRWSRATLGPTLIHVGVIVLLLGGAISLVTKQEGFVVLRAGQPTATLVDYHQRNLSITKKDRKTQVFPREDLYEGMVFLPDIRIVKIHRNARPVAREPRRMLGCIGLACTHELEPLPAGLDDEAHQMGLVLEIGRREAFLTEFANPSLQLDDMTLTFQRVTTQLPFRLQLDRFEQETHPGTTMAKAYRSDVTLTDGNVSRVATIAMNEPLRHRHYTLYQSSVLTLPDGETASVLNVVENPAWLFPYAASILFLLGFSLHLMARRHENA